MLYSNAIAHCPSQEFSRLELNGQTDSPIECCWQMRAALCGETPQLHRRYCYWKKQLASEVETARKQQRWQMAISQEWSGLGKYLREGLVIVSQGILLDTAGLLFRLRVPGARVLFENAIATVLETVYSAVT